VKQTPKPERIEVLIRTPEDWHPSLDESGRGDRAGGFARLLFMALPRGGGWRVQVTGGDDTLMERDYPDGGRAPAFKLFEQLRDGPPVTFAGLKAAGLQRG
jgi:hypothetical protein